MKKIYWTKIWIKYDFYFLRLLLLKPWPWDYSDDFLFTFVSSWFFSNSFLFFISSLSALFLSNSFFLSSFSYLSFSWSTQICLHSSDWGSNLAEPSGFLTFLSVVFFRRLHGTLAWRTPLTTWRSATIEERRGRPNLEQRWGRNSGVIEDKVRSWAAVTSSSTSRISPGESSVPEGWRDNSSPRLEECISPCLPFSALWGVLEWQTWAGQSIAPLQGSLCQSQIEWFIFISNKTFVLIHLLYYHTFIWKYFLSFPSQ